MNCNHSSKYSSHIEGKNISDDVPRHRDFIPVVPTFSKWTLLHLLIPLLLGASAALGATPESAPVPPTWHAQSLGQALLNMLLFAGTGIAAAIIGYKLFDYCTPGDLSKEIIQNKNVAAAIVAAAVILGVSVIVAIAMLG
jgi:hypothetical protein